MVAGSEAVRQQRHHALRLPRLDSLRHGQARDRSQQLVRRDVGTDAACRDGGDEELLESGAKSGIEVRGQRRKGRLARMERARQPTLGREEV